MSIPFDDRGLTLGDGLFETVLANAGALVALEAHAARLARSCVVLGLPPPTLDDLRAAATEALAVAKLSASRAAVRLTWTAGSGGRGLDRPETLSPRLFATAAPAPRVDAPLTLATAAVRRNETSPTSRLKTLNYLDNIIARRQARDAGADEGLMLNSHGQVACAAVANIVWLRQGVLYTPALDCGALAGIVRAEMTAAAGRRGLRVEEVRAEPNALFQAEAVVVTNSLMGARLVTALDGRALDQQSLQVTTLLDLGRR